MPLVTDRVRVELEKDVNMFKKDKHVKDIEIEIG